MLLEQWKNAQTRTTGCHPWRAIEEGDERWFAGDQTELIDTIKKNRLIYLGNALVSWLSKRQATVSRSSTKAEYRAVVNAVAKCIWLRQLLGDLHVDVPSAIIAYCDNVSVVYMIKNPVHHRRTKHIELDIHFVRERVAFGDLHVVHVLTNQQFADVMTKGLPTTMSMVFWSNLTVGPPDAATMGGG